MTQYHKCILAAQEVLLASAQGWCASHSSPRLNLLFPLANGNRQWNTRWLEHNADGTLGSAYKRYRTGLERLDQTLLQRHQEKLQQFERLRVPFVTELLRQPIDFTAAAAVLEDMVRPPYPLDGHPNPTLRTHALNYEFLLDRFEAQLKWLKALPQPVEPEPLPFGTLGDLIDLCKAHFQTQTQESRDAIGAYFETWEPHWQRELFCALTEVPITRHFLLTEEGQRRLNELYQSKAR